MTPRLTEEQIAATETHCRIGGEECDDMRGRVALAHAADAIAQLRQDLAAANQRCVDWAGKFDEAHRLREQMAAERDEARLAFRNSDHLRTEEVAAVLAVCAAAEKERDEAQAIARTLYVHTMHDYATVEAERDECRKLIREYAAAYDGPGKQLARFDAHDALLDYAKREAKDG